MAVLMLLSGIIIAGSLIQVILKSVGLYWHFSSPLVELHLSR